MREHALHLPGSRSRPRLPRVDGVASARLDMLLFSGAIAVVAVHAAVDSSIAPEQGTGPSDHLLRGLATFSVLALAAVVYPRQRAGGRAALAAVLGALALEGAGLAIADARAVGAGGEDWTGSCSFRSALHCLRSPRCCSGGRESRVGRATCAELESQLQPC
jgi:hypothetical protein